MLAFLLQIYIFLSACALDLFATSAAWFLAVFVINVLFKRKALLSAITFLFLVPLAGAEWNYRVDNLHSKAVSNSYTVANKAGVYNLNLWMAAVGAASGYPEVALETFLLGIPGKADTVTLGSSFPMESQKVRSAIERHAASGRQVSTTSLSWNRAEHIADSSRVALALNSFG